MLPSSLHFGPPNRKITYMYFAVKTSYVLDALHKSVLQHLTAQLFIGLYLEYISARELQYSSWSQCEEHSFCSINAPDRSKLYVRVLHCKPVLHCWFSSLRHSLLRQYLMFICTQDSRPVKGSRENRTETTLPVNEKEGGKIVKTANCEYYIWSARVYLIYN